MISKLFIGTNNLNKLKEIKDIFLIQNFNVEIVTPKELDINDEPIEDGNTFEENAIIKAKFYYEKCKLPCISEDSGICIEQLNNFPGIYSKRFLEDFDNYSKNENIISLMKNVKNRKATFHDVICYIDSNGKSHIFEGINYGEISETQKGNEGFGYDPIFYIPEYNKTEAELGNDYKNRYSHRALAFTKLINYLKNE